MKKGNLINENFREKDLKPQRGMRGMAQIQRPQSLRMDSKPTTGL
jgi:hypothetical protein